MTTKTRSILVTGCSSGLGRFTAGFLRSRGWRVIATARREADVARLCDDGFEGLALDLNSTSSIAEACDRAIDITEGSLSGLVNNAGVEVLGAVEDLSRDELRLCFETNVIGTFELTGRLLPAFRRQRFGRIVFVSASNSNGFGYPFLGPGNASKSALETLASSLKRELRHTGISVSSVCPGELSTSLLGTMLNNSQHLLSSCKSVHAKTYSLLGKGFSSANAEATPSNLVPVAEAIARLLESNSPPRRVVVPLSAKLHYLAHAALPEWAQDVLLFRRMKTLFGIHL